MKCQKTVIALFVFALSSLPIHAQLSFPGCAQAFDLTTTGNSIPLDLRYKNCGTTYDITYTTTSAITVVSMGMQQAPDGGAGPGTFAALPATTSVVIIGTNPATTLLNGRMRVTFGSLAGVPAFLRLLATITGTGNVRGSINAVNTTDVMPGGDVTIAPVLSAAPIGNTQLITASTTNSIRVLGFLLGFGTNSSSVGFVYGTGTACGTGTVTLMQPGPIGSTAITLPYSSVGWRIPAGQNFCATVANGALPAAVGVSITYVANAQ